VIHISLKRKLIFKIIKRGSIINVGVPRDRNFGTPTFFANKESME